MKKLYIILFFIITYNFCFAKEQNRFYETSFNCYKKILTKNETKICNDKNLAELDIKTDGLYKEVIRKYKKSNEINDIKKEQNLWKSEIYNDINIFLEISYNERIMYLTKVLCGCNNFDLAVNLIGEDNKRAKKYFYDCINGNSIQDVDINNLRNESRLYLAYLYLSDGNDKKANKLIQEFIENKNCYDEYKDNFCAMDDYEDKIKQYFLDRNQLLEFMQLGVSCFSYNMILDNSNILNYTGSYFGSNRDNFIAGLCGDLKSPYKILSIDSITEIKNYKCIKGEEDEYDDMGSIRFGVYKNKINLIIKLSLFPDLVLKEFKNNNVFIDVSFSSEPQLIYFDDVYKKIQNYNDLLNEYNSLVEQTQDYYSGVLKLNKETAKIYGKMAVDIMILNDLY